MKSKKKDSATKGSKRPESGDALWERTAMAVALFLVALLWASSLSPENRLWGFNHWAYFPFWLRTTVVALGLIIFIPRVNRRLQGLLKQTVVAGFRSLVERRRHVGYPLVGAVSLLTFYLLRTRTDLLGDGFQILERIDAGSLTLHWSQPLAIWIYLTSFDLLHPLLDLDGAATYALISYLSGLIYVVFALRVALLMGKSSSARLFVFLILLLMGSTQLVFGYAEHYPLLCSGVLIYLFYSLKYLRGESRILVPLIILIILIPLHFSSLCLIPSVLLLFFFKEEGKDSIQVFQGARFWLAFLVLLIALTALVWYLREYNWYFLSYLVPLLQGGYTGPDYTLFSPSHLADVLNQQALISPVGFLLFLLFLVFKAKTLVGQDRTFQFLLVVSLAQLLFNFLINPGLGAARDWDLFASVGLGYTLLALHIFSRTTSDSRIRYLKLSLTTVAILFVLPWVMVNSSPEKSVARFRNLLDLDPRKSRNGHFILAGYFDGMGKPEEVDRENRMIQRKFPETELVNQGLALLQKGELQKAREIFARAINIAPGFAEAHVGLGKYHAKTGNDRQAEIELKRALELKPDYGGAYRDLGDVYIQRGEFREAERFYGRATKMGLGDPQVFNNLGILYVQLGDLDKAASSYQRAIVLKSDFPQPRYGLSFVYYRQGKLEESLRAVNLLLQIDPDFALGYHQLGQTYEGMGRKKDAASAYQRYLEMQPDAPDAAKIRQKIENLRTE
ncbi:MAG: tetratricopeptide repeat protein [Candidatus Zixiibacteriota bacterium]|nr:MAG: tetratricopeptide repeat protein [candidate division Zixibacteria bacterium]